MDFHRPFLALATALVAFSFCGMAQDDAVTPWISVWAYPSSEILFHVGLDKPPSPAAIAELEKALGKVEVTRPWEDEEIWWVDGQFPEVAERRHFVIKGTVPIEPLMQFVARTAESEVDFDFGCRSSAEHRVSWAGMDESAEPGWWYSAKTLSAGEQLPTLEFECGFPLWRVLLYPVATVLLVAALIGYLLWRREAALKEATKDRAAAWFQYYVASQSVYFAGAAVILAPSLLLDLGEFIGFITGAESPLLLSSISLASMLAPYLVLTGLAAAVSYPVYTRVRGAQVARQDLVLQGVLGALMWGATLCFALVGMTALIEGMPLVAVILVLCAVGSFLLIANLWWKMFRVRRERLTECPLRDRINSLAEKAGVKLKDLQILTPGIRLFSANAFSMQGARLILTDCLIEGLTTREVDAIVGHELAHARRKHPEKKVRLRIMCWLLAVVLVAAGLGFDVTSAIPIPTDLQWAVFCILGLGLWLLFSSAVSRRNERQADADAIDLTGDPEAFITGLTKVCRLNLWPVQWKKRVELILSHPSLMRRLEPIAARAGIGAERLQSLVESGHTGDSYYAIPASVLDDAKVFSSDARRRILLLITLALRILCAAPPALVALAVYRYDVQGTARAAVYLAGVLLTLAGLVSISGFLNMTGRRKLRSRLSAKLARQGFNFKDYRPVLVGFSPDDSLRMYEAFSNTDIGFLFSAGDKLVFLGDSMRFSIPRQHLVSADLGRPFRGWYRWRRVVIQWRANGRSGVFCVSSYDVVHASRITKANQRILDSIKAWQSGRQPVGTEASEFDQLGLPEEVAADGMPLHVPWRLVFRTGWPPVFLSLLLCIAFGIAALNTNANLPFYAMAATMLVHILYHLPYTRR